MVLGLFVDLSVLNGQAHGSGARLNHQETRATMAGIVPMFILLDKASICTFLGFGVRSPHFGLVRRVMDAV